METKKTAQMRLNPISPTSLRTADPERTQPIQPKIIGRFAKKRKFKARDPQIYIPKRPLIETLIGAIEASRTRTLDNYT